MESSKEDYINLKVEENQHQSDKFDSSDLTRNTTISTSSQKTEKNTNWAKSFWKWTGLDQTTLLELLQLSASIAIPIAIAMLSYQQEQINMKTRKLELKIAEDNQHQEVLSSYLDQMTDLMLKEKLTDPNLNSGARSIARARTLNTLRQLDGERKGQLLKFLYEAGLIGAPCSAPEKTGKTGKLQDCGQSTINLDGARLNETIFEPPVPLKGIDLTGASLAKAKLRGIDLTNAEMQKVTLRGTDLTKAILTGALLDNADLTRITLVDAILPRAQLTNSILTRANLKGANFKQAVFKGSDLQGANFSNTILTGANFQGAKLENADLSYADLQGSDLRNADLSGAILQGANFKEAIYNTATKFPTGFDQNGKGMRQQP